MTDEIKVETPVETLDKTIAQAVETVQPIVENEQEINWRKFRQQREEERKQKEAAEKYAREKENEAIALQNALNALVNKPSHAREERQYEEEETEDQRIDKKVNAALRLREIEMDKIKAERERIEFPQKLQTTFKDFNQICTSENLDYLEYHYPEVARGYKHMPDGYDKWEGIYMALKKFIPNKNSIQEGKKADNNLSKPQSMSKGGMTQTGDHAPSRIDAQTRASNYARMQKVIKGI